MTSPNTDQAEYWNGEEAAHWLDHEARYEAMLRPYTDHLLAAAAIAHAERVLDVGCGCGATTRAAARIGWPGETLGVDLSEAMLARAREHAAAKSITNVTFVRGDAQVHPLPDARYEVVISRFGAMFFDDPVAAFANIARGVRSGGRLVFVCWQPVPENEWIVVPGLAAARHIALPPLSEPGSPGPFAFGDPETVRGTLNGAGWKDVDIAEAREALLVGRDVEDTVAFLRDSGMGRRVLEGLDDATTARIVGALEEALAPYSRPDGVRLGSAAWLVTARRA